MLINVHKVFTLFTNNYSYHSLIFISQGYDDKAIFSFAFHPKKNNIRLTVGEHSFHASLFKPFFSYCDLRCLISNVLRRLNYYRFSLGSKMSFLRQLLMAFFLAAFVTLICLISTSPCPNSKDQNYCQTNKEYSQVENCLYLMVYREINCTTFYKNTLILLFIIAVIFTYATNIKNFLYIFMPPINYVKNRGQGNST